MTQCPDSCGMKPTDRRLSIETVPDNEGGYNMTPGLHTHVTLNGRDGTFVTFVDFGSEVVGAGSTVLQQLSQKAAELSPVKFFVDLISNPYQEFKDVFAKNPSTSFPLINHGIMQSSSDHVQSPLAQRCIQCLQLSRNWMHFLRRI